MEAAGIEPASIYLLSADRYMFSLLGLTSHFAANKLRLVLHSLKFGTTRWNAYLLLLVRVNYTHLVTQTSYQADIPQAALATGAAMTFGKSAITLSAIDFRHPLLTRRASKAGHAQRTSV